MYFVTPNHSVALNPKAGSSTLARAIIAAFYPDEEHTIQTATYPAGKGPATNGVHWLCPKELTPSKPVVLIVREPTSRFRAAMAQTGLTDGDAALAALEQGSTVPFARQQLHLRTDAHFRHQHKLLRGGTAFRLENFDDAAKFIGLSLPLPVINAAKRPKPDLTPEQVQRILAYYAADAALYADLSHPV